MLKIDTCSLYSKRPVQTQNHPLVEETNDLSGDVLATGLLVVHDTGGGSEDDVSELTRWEELDNPLLELTEADVVSWGDDTGLVETVLESARVHRISQTEELTGRSIG